MSYKTAKKHTVIPISSDLQLESHAEQKNSRGDSFPAANNRHTFRRLTCITVWRFQIVLLWIRISHSMLMQIWIRLKLVKSTGNFLNKNDLIAKKTDVLNKK